MEESKERVFYVGLHVAGMCHSSHAKWQKGYFLMKLKELVRGPHREHGMASMPEGQSDRWVDPCVALVRKTLVGATLAERAEVVVKPTLLQRASCRAEVRGWE